MDYGSEKQTLIIWVYVYIILFVLQFFDRFFLKFKEDKFSFLMMIKK